VADDRSGVGLPGRSTIDAAAGQPKELNQLLSALAIAATAGDHDAAELLLYAVASQKLAEPGIRNVLFEPDDIDEVSQNVLITVAEKIGDYRGDSRFTTWLFRVSKNKAIEFVRRKRDTAEFRTELGDTERISSMIANQVSAQSLLAELPDRYRSAVTMRDLHGMTYVEIASALNMNVNTVRTHIARGRALLAARLERYGQRPENS